LSVGKLVERLAGDMRVAGGVDGDGQALVVAGTAKVRTIGEHGIDDQRSGGVVQAGNKADAVGA
jgi:hypothetical protein